MVRYENYTRGIAIAGACAIAICSSSVEALDGDDPNVAFDIEQWVTLDGPVTPWSETRGDQFLNYDANWNDGTPNTSKKLDWPVNLIFVSSGPDLVSTSKVKAILDTAPPGGQAFPETGGQMFALMFVEALAQQRWDVDRGRKLFDTTCRDDEVVNPDANYHFRIYGPDGEGKLFHPDYGHFVFATSHIDFRENCEGAWFGESETAEAFIATTFARHGLWVEPNKIWLGNAIAQGHSQSDGFATVIHLDVTVDDELEEHPPTEEEPPPTTTQFPPATSELPARNGCVYVQYCNYPDHPAGTVCRAYPGCEVAEENVAECRADVQTVCGGAAAPFLFCDRASSSCIEL